MKRFSPFLFALLVLSACGKKETTTTTTTAQIARLKKERADIDAKIHDLEAKSGVKDSVKSVPVAVITVQPQSFQSFIDVQGSVTGDENVLATPQAQGIVRRVLVHAGQQVGRGATLATMDAGPVDQQIAALDANLSLMRTMYEKQQKLWAQQIGTEMQLLQAKANYENISKQRAALVSQRDMYRITAPISGVVDLVDLKEGDAAMPGGQKGIRVVNNNKLKAEAHLGEVYLGKVRVGDPVTLIFPDLNDSVRTRVSFVSPAVDPVSRAFSVQVQLGSTAGLHPNMSTRMKIANYQRANVITVPISAVQQTGNGQVVYVANGKTAKAVTVQTGRSSEGQIEILAGLNAGDQVITAGYEELDNGSAIAVQ